MTNSFRRPLGRLALGAALAGTGLPLTNCAGSSQQQEEGKNFQNCTFALQSIGQATLGGVDHARQALAALPQLGLDLGELTHQLAAEGGQKFKEPFAKMLASVEQKR